MSYERDKRALELGALPPLDISRSESEVAARKVQMHSGRICADAGRRSSALHHRRRPGSAVQVAAARTDRESRTQPNCETVDADAVLKEALSNRPEIEAAKDALEATNTAFDWRDNQLKPDLELNGFYQSTGLGGNQYSLTTGQLTSTGGLGTSFNQLFGFGFPGYGGQLTLNLPVRNRAGQARLGNSLVAEPAISMRSRQAEEQITRQVRDALHQFDTAKLSLTAAETSLDLAKKSLAADQRKFELGAETNFFVLDSQSRLANAELILLQTRISYQLALAAIQHASGDLLAPFHLQIEALTK